MAARFTEHTLVPALRLMVPGTPFTCPVREADNAVSWSFPVLIEQVFGAFVKRVVAGRFTGAPPLLEAGRRLFEWANMQSHAAAMRHATELPVCDARALERELWSTATATKTASASSQA